MWNIQYNNTTTPRRLHVLNVLIMVLICFWLLSSFQPRRPEIGGREIELWFCVFVAYDAQSIFRSCHFLASAFRRIYIAFFLYWLVMP